jgi:phage terminase large subunit-like protein
VDVPSVFQIWRRRLTNLRLVKPQTEHKDLEIRIYNKTESAKKQLVWDWDIAVKRNSKNGEFITKGETATEDYHWILIKTRNKSTYKRLLSIDWSKLNDNKMTAGMGKADVVKAYKGN